MIIKPNIYKRLVKLLELKKPLVIFDVETTGLNLSTDKIVEIAYVKIYENGRLKKDDILLDPEMPITLEATAVHGISTGDLRGKPAFKDKAQELYEVFSDCYYSGFNVVNFDLPILRREFIRVGMDFDYDVKQIIDTREIFLRMVPRSLSATYEYYCHKNFTQYHTALNDTEVAAEILVRQLEKYKEIQNWEFINKIHQMEEEDHLDSTRKFYWVHGEAYFAFSKYKDQRVSGVAKSDPDFLNWILVADFSEETKNVVRQALEKHNPKALQNKDNTK